MLAAEPSFLFFGQPSAHAAAAARYCRVEAFGILPVLLFQTCRLSLQGTDAFAPLVRAVLVANALNVAMNRALIDGVAALGVPAMGLDGAAWATVCSRWSLLDPRARLRQRQARGPVPPRMRLGGHLLDGNEEHIHRDEKTCPETSSRPAPRTSLARVSRSPVLCSRVVPRVHAPASRRVHRRADVRRVRRVRRDEPDGGPVRFHGGGGARRRAVPHRRELRRPARRRRVGFGEGGARTSARGIRSAATEAARTSLKRGAIGVALNALVFVCFGTQLCGFFTDDPSVIRTAATLAPTLAAYQAFDGLRVVGAGCLRGSGG